MLGQLGITPKTGPAYDGTTSWFEYEQLIDDRRTIPRHFLGLFKAWRGYQDFVTWIAKFEIVLQRVFNSWMDLYAIRPNKQRMQRPTFRSGIRNAPILPTE
eukprot:s1201_g13.t1